MDTEKNTPESNTPEGNTPAVIIPEEKAPIMSKKNRVVFICSIALIAVSYILMVLTPLGQLGLKKENGGHGLFDTMLLYSSDTFYQILDGTSERGLWLYIQTHIFDYFFMASLFVGETLLLQYLLKKHKLERLNLLYIFPVGELFFDLVENIFLDVLVSSYPTRHTGLVSLVNLASMAKWYFSLGFVVTVILILWLAYKKKKTQKPDKKQT